MNRSRPWLIVPADWREKPFWAWAILQMIPDEFLSVYDTMILSGYGGA